MKVAHIFPFYGVNGLDRYIATLNHYMKRNEEAEVYNFIVVQKEQLSALREAEYFHEPTTTVVLSSFSPKPVINMFADCFLPEIEDEFRKFLAAVKPDVVNFQHLSDLGASLVGIAKDSGIQTVATFHDYWAICPRNFLVNYRLETCRGPNFGANCINCFYPEEVSVSTNEAGQLFFRYSFIKEMLIGKTDLIITVSDSMRDKLVHEGIPGEKIMTIYPSVEPVKQPARTKRKNDRFHIGFVGHWTPIKGPHILIEAFKRLQRSDIHLYLYGTEEPLFRSTLLRLADNWENIHFVGAYKPQEAAQVYANLDLLVAPSICPEQPLVILEAFQYGIPVIGSRLGGIPEYIHERCGLLFEAGSVSDLTEKLRAVIDHPELLEEWINHIPVWQTAQEMSAKVYEEYKRLCNGKRHSHTVSNEHTALFEPHNKGFLRKQVFPVQLQKLVRELKRRGISRVGIFPAMVDSPAIVKELARHGMRTVCFIDNNPGLRNTLFEGIPILMPDEVTENQLERFDMLVVTSSHEASIMNQLEISGWNVPYVGFYSL